MNPDNTFQLTLSAAELYWLAGAFGKTFLPLPCDPFLDLGPAARTEALSKAPDSLQARSLIRRTPGTGWQVDPLPAMLIQWLAEPESILKVERKTPAGENAEGWFFILHKNSLWLEFKTDGFHLVLFREPADASKHAMRFSGIGEGSAHEIATRFRVPQPDEFLPIAWHDSQKAVIILQHAGLNEKEISDNLACVGAVSCAAFFTHLAPQDNKLETLTQNALLAADGRVWGTTTTDAEQVSFEPLDNSQMQKKFLEVLTPLLQ